MHYNIIRVALVMIFTLLCSSPSMALMSGYAVAPFTVKGPEGFAYLQKAVPSMLTSRLYWKGHFEPVPDTASLSPITSSKDAQSVAARANADYVVWGTIKINGNDAHVTANVTGSKGKEWRKEAKTTVSNLIVTLQNLSDSINSELFGRATVAPAAIAQQQDATGARSLNPNMIQNQQAQSSATYLNPQIRYQGADGSKMRSQHLPFKSVGMEIGDFDGDGKNEVAILTSNRVYVYRWTDKLNLLEEYKLPRTQLALSIRSMDLDRDKVPEIIISSVGVDTTITSAGQSMASLGTEPDKPYGHILSFKGGKMKEFCKPVRYYISVAYLPPDFRPVLVGQRGDLNRGFDASSGVHEMERDGKSFSLGHKITLPKDTNLMSFVFLPENSYSSSQTVVNLNHNERLQVFYEKDFKDALYTSGEPYSGSPAVLECPASMPGLGKDYSVNPNMVYIPMRMLVTDLDRNRHPEVLVNKPISVAAQFFNNYREYPEGEIQALSWDGVGLNLLWKTRRIKGTVIDFGINDVNNNGVKDLTVCLNTYAGALGIAKSRTVLVAYPLDLENADPNTPPVME